MNNMVLTHEDDEVEDVITEETEQEENTSDTE
jgi:hypothetical protein